MSQVNLQFTVNSYSSTFTAEATNFTVNPNSTQLTVYAGYAAFPPSGSLGNGQVLFNDAGLFAGSDYFKYAKTSNTLTVTNATVTGVSTLGPVANVKISGGAPGQVIKTDGAGNLSFYTITPGGANTQLQYNNNGVFAGMPDVTYVGTTLTLGNVENVKVKGGTNGYVLQTDGTGNLTWTAQTGGGGGSGTPGGANTQIQYNNAGSFGGDTGFTYNELTNTMTVENISTASLTSTGNLTITGNINQTGNIAVTGNISVTGNLVGNVLGNISGHSNTANYANYAGNITIASQPNVTSLGTLTVLNVSGTTSIQQAIEKINQSASVTTNYNYDLLDQAIFYRTGSAVANFSINFRGNSTTALSSILAINKSITCTFINTTGYPAGYLNTVHVDGITVTPVWLNGAPTSALTNATEVYSFNIMRTGGSDLAPTYTVFVSRGTYY